jgi:hypothetical protein
LISALFTFIPMKKNKITPAFVSVLISLFSFSQNVKYDINDPRNPLCPCHKYQKLANEEYDKLLAMNNKNTPYNANPVQQGFIPNNKASALRINFDNSTDKITKSTTTDKIKHRRKRKIKKHNSLRRMLDGVHRDFWKRSPIADACSHW